MKTVYINSVCGYGSTGRIVADQYRETVSAGDEAVVVYGRGTAPADIQTYQIGSKWDNYAHVAQTRLFDHHGFGSKKATEKLVAYLQAYQPDVIHLHNLHGYYLNIEVLFDYLATLDIPIFWTLHDCWAFTGHCAYFDYVGCQKWQTGCGTCPQKKAYPTSIVLDASAKNFSAKKFLFTSMKNMTIITPSQWLADLVKQSFLKQYPVVVKYNTIDTEIFQPTPSDFRARYHIGDKKIVLGVASVWEQRKGLATFSELASKLDDTFQIVVVGVSSKQKNELPASIIAIERTNSAQELAAIYTAADVFVNSTLEEVLGMTNLEAIACGTYVITYDTGGAPETLTPGMGCIVEKGNIEALEKEIIQYLEQRN